jgi:hypothetical protein
MEEVKCSWKLADFPTSKSSQAGWLARVELDKMVSSLTWSHNQAKIGGLLEA